MSSDVEACWSPKNGELSGFVIKTPKKAALIWCYGNFSGANFHPRLENLRTHPAIKGVPWAKTHWGSIVTGSCSAAKQPRCFFWITWSWDPWPFWDTLIYIYIHTYYYIHSYILIIYIYIYIHIHHHSCDVAVKLLYYNCYDSSGLMFELQRHKTHAPQHHQGPVGQSLGDLSATSPQFAVVDVHDSSHLQNTHCIGPKKKSFIHPPWFWGVESSYSGMNLVSSRAQNPDTYWYHDLVPR